MRQPFWIINSSLLLLALIAAGFIYLGRPSIPELQDIEPRPYRAPRKVESATVNIAKIYEYDLFDTYQKELIPTQAPDYVIPLPESPIPMAARIPEEPKPQFIEPLPITLKGIVIVLNDDSKNRAVIMDNRTNKELSYRVGDAVEDAQLIRIFSNKVILMRSNGQQEVLYLRERDAKLDPTYAAIDNWQEIITQTNSNTFVINSAEFVNRIKSLAQFIDTLEITTAYKQGESIGIKVTNIGPGTLGLTLGLTKEDIILKVNDMPLAQTQNRLAIYNHIIGLKTNDTIHVTLVRNNREIVLNYLLQEVQQPRKQEIGLRKLPADEITAEQKKQLEAKHSFAPTLQEIRSREKANMLQKVHRPTQNVLSNLNE